MDEVVGKFSRSFNIHGEQIVNPLHSGRTAPKERRPQDFVEITQLEYRQVVTDPYGEEQETSSLGNPIEEVYYRWVWENETWYPLITAVVKNSVFVIDRRPEGWDFVEQFNQNKPDLKRWMKTAKN